MTPILWLIWSASLSALFECCCRILKRYAITWVLAVPPVGQPRSFQTKRSEGTPCDAWLRPSLPEPGRRSLDDVAEVWIVHGLSGCILIQISCGAQASLPGVLKVEISRIHSHQSNQPLGTNDGRVRHIMSSGLVLGKISRFPGPRQLLQSQTESTRDGGTSGATRKLKPSQWWARWVMKSEGHLLYKKETSCKFPGGSTT